jgi:FkbM family methyltransferase
MMSSSGVDPAPTGNAESTISAETTLGARVLARMISGLNGYLHFGNPLQICIKRLFPGRGLMTIIDRRTGLTVSAIPRSYRMFAETWYDHDYDVPACPIRANDIVMDIGANQGFFSCYAAAKGARVHAYEPSPESCARLRANVERNGLSRKVTISQVAVSDSEARVALLCSDFLGGGANTIVRQHAEALGKEFHSDSEVQTVAINSVLDDIPGQIRLCKIDCEGSEYEILRSITNPSRIDSFAIEFHPKVYPLQELLAHLLAWNTHQVSFSRTAYILFAVRNEIVLEYAGNEFPIRGI